MSESLANIPVNLLQMLDDILPQTKRKARMEAEEKRTQTSGQVSRVNRSQIRRN